MPVFSCGGMRYQHKWDDVPLSEVPTEGQANLEATIRRALELGINHIETARGYGSSERQLGLVLPTIPRDELIVQTKLAPTRDADEFVAQFRESLERLQLDHVDLLALHGINTYELLWWSTKPGGCLEAARRLQKEGLARHIGFSTHGSPDMILDAVCHERDGGFDYINLHWYYIYQRNWPAVEAAAERDMGVFIISPSEKGGMLFKPTQKLVELCEPLHPLVFNCLFCLSRPEVHTLSIGASCPGDFDLQMSTLEHMDDAEGLVGPIVERLNAAYVEAVGEEFAGRWLEGLPEWESSPGHVNMQIILWLRSLAVAYDMTGYAKMRYNLIGNGGHWFAGLNAAHVDSLDFAKALAKSPFAEEIPGWLREAHEMLFEKPKRRLSEGG